MERPAAPAALASDQNSENAPSTEPAPNGNLTQNAQNAASPENAEEEKKYTLAKGARILFEYSETRARLDLKKLRNERTQCFGRTSA